MSGFPDAAGKTDKSQLEQQQQQQQGQSRGWLWDWCCRQQQQQLPAASKHPYSTGTVFWQDFSASIHVLCLSEIKYAMMAQSIVGVPGAMTLLCNLSTTVDFSTGQDMEALPPWLREYMAGACVLVGVFIFYDLQGAACVLEASCGGGPCFAQLWLCVRTLYLAPNNCCHRPVSQVPASSWTCVPAKTQLTLLYCTSHFCSPQVPARSCTSLTASLKA
jgi:hypothetical protein